MSVLSQTAAHPFRLARLLCTHGVNVLAFEETHYDTRWGLVPSFAVAEVPKLFLLARHSKSLVPIEQTPHYAFARSVLGDGMYSRDTYRKAYPERSHMEPHFENLVHTASKPALVRMRAFGRGFRIIDGVHHAAAEVARGADNLICRLTFQAKPIRVSATTLQSQLAE